MHAATLDQTASNLPTTVCQDGKWNVIGQLGVGPNTGSSPGIDLEALGTGIQAEGYYLWNADMEPLPNSLHLQTIAPE